jgi:lipase
VSVEAGRQIVLSGSVLLVHGLFGTLNTREILNCFPPGRVIAPDLLGYGTLRAVPANRISIEAQVTHLGQVVEQHFGSEPVHMVGHSLGGLLVNLLAYSRPAMARSIVNVEGNFTLKDAFWSSSISRMTQRDVDSMLAGFRQDPGAWLEGAGIRPSPERIELARHWLERQPGRTIRTMAVATVRESTAEYLEKVEFIFREKPVHLVAGERSYHEWDVPAWARKRAASITIMSNGGHLMMLEEAHQFAWSVAALLEQTERLTNA